jgi:hypothetical protein
MRERSDVLFCEKQRSIESLTELLGIEKKEGR